MDGTLDLNEHLVANPTATFFVRASGTSMLDAGIQDVRLFQFILLPGTEAAGPAHRARFQYLTGFRVLARCFGRYEMLGESVDAAEVQEVCLGTNTMSREDYNECRAFDLTVAIFNNGGVVTNPNNLNAYGASNVCIIGNSGAAGTASSRRCSSARSPRRWCAPRPVPS